MSGREWKRYFWRNAATNYLRTVLRLVSGLVLFRLTFQFLGTDEFGFYSLLWSLFGYTILLDFGLGFTAQKTVAEHAGSGDAGEINRLVGTVFWTFAFFGAVLLGVFGVLEGWFLGVIRVESGDMESFGLAYRIFFAAMAVMLPLGLFPEMLRGLQRIDLANWAAIGSLALNLGLLAWGLVAGWPFPMIVLVSVATTVAPNLIAAVIVTRRLPGFSLHPRHFRFSAIQGVLSFSVIAYLITFTNLIMARTDQAVIGCTIGVGFIAMYQAGFKVAEMFGLFSVQMQDALTPAAAQLNAGRDREGLRELLVGSTRLTLLLVIPLYALCVAYLEPLVKVLTGLEAVPVETFWVGQALLFATFSSLVTSSCSKRVLMMCGWEKRLLRISLFDAGANLLLSLALVFRFGILGVALGTMIPTVLVGWLLVVPLAARFLETSVARMLGDFLRPVFLPVAAALGTLLVLVYFLPLGDLHPLVGMGWRGALVVGVLAALAAPMLMALRKKA